MSKLWIAFALLACLSFAACGGQGGGESGEGDNGGAEPEPAPVVDPMVGTWALDTDAAVKAVEEKQKAEPNPMGEMILQVVKAMKAEMELKEDGTYTAKMQMKNPLSGEEESQTAKGTWKLEGDKFSITTIEEDGVVKATPDVEVAVYKDGVITVEAKGGAPFPMVFKKK